MLAAVANIVVIIVLLTIASATAVATDERDANVAPYTRHDDVVCSVRVC